MSQMSQMGQMIQMIQGMNETMERLHASAWGRTWTQWGRVAIGECDYVMSADDELITFHNCCHVMDGVWVGN